MKLSRVLSKLAFSLQRSRQNSKKEAWNARGVENRVFGEIPQAGSKKKYAELGGQAKNWLCTPLVREAFFEKVVVVRGRRSDTPEFGSKR